MEQPLLSVKDVQMVFQSRKGNFPAVDGLSFELSQGEILGIVGESGSGKTMTSLTVMNLLPGQGKIERGEILYRGRDLRGLSDREMCRIRGKEISMIFQDPMMSLDQVYTVGSQMTEAILAHEKQPRKALKERCLALLDSVGIANPERVFNSYPFQLSGGMCQRVMIAIALSCDPMLLIADEPTTALDVTVQAQILELLEKIRRERNIGIILITHDLDVVEDMADRIMVMYAGKVMETAPRETLFSDPRHMYTKGLLSSVPRMDSEERLHSIPGVVPDIRAMPEGCRFCTRCPRADERCKTQAPPMLEVGPQHFAACWYGRKEEQRG